MNRHINYLKIVFIHSITAFGGPQTHFTILHKLFAIQNKYITEDELKEYNAICQLLPGPTSTQILTLIGFKRGGVLLAGLTLLIWIIPATILMTLLSFILYSTKNLRLENTLFLYIQPMAVSFILYSTYKLLLKYLANKLNIIFIVFIAGLTYLFFKTPFIFPILIIGAGICSNFSRKEKDEQTNIKPKKIIWNYLIIFSLIFSIIGTISEKASVENWKSKKLINLFETNYRFGSLVFGGGDVLIPMMYEQYVARPLDYDSIKNKRQINSIDRNDFLIASGLVRALPGPIFAISSFTGGMILYNDGPFYHILGSIIATIAIFLPGFLLVLFFFPLWNNLKKYKVINNSIQGIHIAVVGIMLGSSCFLFKDLIIFNNPQTQFSSIGLNILVVLTVFILLMIKKFPTFLIIVLCLLAGLVIH